MGAMLDCTSKPVAAKTSHTHRNSEVKTKFVPAMKGENEFCSSIANFSGRFIDELEKKNKSVISSPLSAEFVLALLALGASGTAREELLSALGLPDDDTIRSLFLDLTSKLKSLKGVTLRVANKVYLKKGRYELQPALARDAADVFDASIRTLDFEDSEGAANVINEWVKKKTNNKITDIITPDSINDNTRMILLNAIYFKGIWCKKFNKENTEEKLFHVNVNRTIKVPMMHKYAMYEYIDSSELGAQILEMPYEGNETSMVIILPHQVDGITDLLKKLASDHDLLQYLKRLRRCEVEVTLPKFKIETELDLKVLLPKLGIKEIFNDHTVELDKMLVYSKGENIYVSDAKQKAFIEVNEEGAEAAVVTYQGMMVLRCARVTPPPPPVIFRADRPFLYILVSHGRILLFIGVYNG